MQNVQLEVIFSVFLAENLRFEASDRESGSSSKGWRGVDSDTLFMTYSVAKGITASAMLVLADQGELDFSESTHAIWPGLTAPYDDADHTLTVAEAIS